MNLREEPKAILRHGKRATLVTAQEVEGAHRDRLWDLATEAFPLYKSYQSKTRRRIPLFVLEPLDSQDVTA